MKYINKFLFFLIFLFVFINFQKPFSVYAEDFNSKELKVFLDSISKETIEKYKLPSLSIVVVKDGQVIYENALGYADIDNKIKADVNTTVYRIGSISKLFTETAIMQLYEQGKIDLNEDANKYLREVKIKNKFTKKVTVENLLTHTSGIDEATPTYNVAKTENEMISLSEFLKKHPPVVVTEPGKISLYSNIGIDLLGRIIENVSGMTYEEYIQRNIFDVLNMKSSKVTLPLNNMAKNYESFAPSEYYYYNDSPAGGINSTPSDMGKFMIAHLQNGVYKNQKILTEDTVKLMHEHHFANDNNLLGVGYGFWEKSFNGRRIIGHEGALAIGYFNDMLLYQEENLGIYIVSNNLTGAAPAITNIEKSFFNKFFPDNNINDYSHTKINSHTAAKYTGTYRSYHDSAKSNIFKFISFLGGIEENEDVRIEYDKNKNALIYHGVSHLKQKEEVPLIMVSNNLFRRVDNNDLVAFREENDKVKYVFLNCAPYESFEKINFKDNYKLNLVVFISAVVFFLIQILKNMFLFLKKLFKRKLNYKYVKKENFKISRCKLFKLMIFIISLMNLASVFGILYWIISFDMYYSVTWYVKISLLLLIVSTAFVVISSIIFVLSIKKEKPKLSYKIIGFFNLFSIYTFILFLYNWNLLGFKY